MSREANKALVEHFYTMLANKELDKLGDLHHDDVIFNVLGRTPVSGRFVGKEACLGKQSVASTVFQELLADYRFAVEWRVVCADDDTVVGMMRSEGATRNGGRYDQTYCQVFHLRDGLIAEMHEFLDTVVVESALFGNELGKPEHDLESPLQIGA